MSPPPPPQQKNNSCMPSMPMFFTLAFLYPVKQLFQDFLLFKGNFIRSRKDSQYRGVAPLRYMCILHSTSYPPAEFILLFNSGSRGSRHSTDSGATSDSGEARDAVFDEKSSPFRSDLEASPPVSPTTPPPFQKGAYISKVKAVQANSYKYISRT